MLIDALPAISPRPQEMEVLAMGFSRTGTLCMQHLSHKVKAVAKGCSIAASLRDAEDKNLPHARCLQDQNLPTIA